MIFFTTINLVKQNTLIDSTVSDKVLTNILSDSHEVYLQEVLGNDLYVVLQNAVVNNNLTTKQKTLIDNYVVKYLFAVTEKLCLDDLYIKYTQNGVYSANPSNTSSKSIDELKSIKITKERKISVYEGLIKSFIEDNEDDFTEYFEVDQYIPPIEGQRYGFYFEED
jgi:hypothetical protein